MLFASLIRLTENLRLCNYMKLYKCSVVIICQRTKEKSIKISNGPVYN